MKFFLQKDGAYAINLDEYAGVGTHGIALFFRKTEIVYFDSLVLIIFLKKLKNSLEKNIKANVFRVQASSSIMYKYFFIGFNDFMITGKKLTDFTSSLPYYFE